MVTHLAFSLNRKAIVDGILIPKYYDREVSASLRKASRFLAEIGQPRIRRTEVRPMFSRRAISALLTPARYSFRTVPV